MNQLCKEFSKASEYIFNWFSYKTTVKEESFTDWILYNLSQSLTNFKYYEFSRIEENAISGADFDFWIVGANRHIAMRIQAKKLQRTGSHYRALTYPGNKAQINLLMSSSTPPLKPFYLFYNNDVNSGNCAKNPCGTLISDAITLNSKFLLGGNVKISRQDIIDNSIPFECLFCCFLSQTRSDKLEGIKQVIANYFPLTESANQESNNADNEELPEQVKDVLNSELTNAQWSEKYSNEKSSLVKYVAVLDLRKD